MITLLLLLILFCYPFRTLLSLSNSFIFFIFFPSPHSFEPYLVSFFPFFKLLAIKKQTKKNHPTFVYLHSCSQARFSNSFLLSSHFSVITSPSFFFKQYLEYPTSVINFLYFECALGSLDLSKNHFQNYRSRSQCTCFLFNSSFL